MNQSLELKVEERTNELVIVNERLTLANKQLMQVTEARRLLLANISHELGTSITLIQSYVQAVKEGIIDAEDRYYLNMVSDRVKILGRLTDDLFDLSKLEAGQMSLNYTVMILEQWVRKVAQQCEQEIIQGKRKFVSLSLHIPMTQWNECTCRIDVD